MTGRALTDAELVAWQSALDLWGVQLHQPNMVRDSATGTFAWFTFPPSISIDLDALTRQGAENHLISVFAHEIGHHVLSPSTRIVSFKLAQQMARAIVASDPRRAVPVTSMARHLSNLWSDLLINDSGPDAAPPAPRCRTRHDRLVAHADCPGAGDECGVVGADARL